MSSKCRRRTYVALSVLDNLVNRLYKSETRGDPGLFLVEFNIKGAVIGEVIVHKTFLTSIVQVGCKPIIRGAILFPKPYAFNLESRIE